MDTRIENETSFPPTTGRFPDTNTAKMFLGENRFSIGASVPNKGTARLRAKFRARNTASSFSPRVKSLFERRGSVAPYFDRYTWETINPVMKMKDGVRNLRYV